MKRYLMPLMLVLAGAPAFAHEGGRVSPEVRQQMVDSELDQLASRIGLDAQGTARLRATFDKYRAQLEPMRKQMWETRKELKAAVESAQPDEQRVAQLNDQLAAARVKMQAVNEQRTQELKQQLTPSQFAKLQLERHHFARDLRRQMRQARAANPAPVK